ncbi:zf-TFIIB domain-containing protein [Halorussus litoreus]|uniref:zf-TFIIB domain-containing protein n=1 Tax=Halorussus litoreus TaxID=1710536 RepID=UPI000E2795A2|nr:zf-TFIIB domain-containing protein [Halorussus litoreus]
MTSEYDLGCANCGGSLARREVPPEALAFPVSESVEVAECPNCGGRYVPEATLERVGGDGFGRQT